MPKEKTETVEAPKEGYVSVKKERLDEILRRMERLEATASKAQLAHYDSQRPDEKQTEIRLKAINGKVVIGWESLVANVVEKNEHGVWSEDQRIKVTYEDSTTEEMPYVFFSRRYKNLPALMVSQTKHSKKADIEKYGDYTYELDVDGRIYKVGSRFVN